MATLNIPFPDGAKKLALRGKRITVGRLPDNLIQIRDLTISGKHAELIFEGDHYRVHDLQSTNGVFVDGQQVEDFHLHEGCTLRLGTVECEFFAEDAPTGEDAPEAVPTNIEMRALKQANGELKAQLEVLRTQNETMRDARASATPDKEGTVSLEKHDQLAAEVAALQTAQAEQRTQVEAIRTQLAVVSRERDNLQRAYDDARGHLENASNGSGDGGVSPAADRPAAGANGASKAQPLPMPPATLRAPSPSAANPVAPTAPIAPAAAPVLAAPAMPAAPRPPQGPPPGPTVPRSVSGKPTIPLAQPIQAAPAAPTPAGPPRPAPVLAPIRQPSSLGYAENAQPAPLPKPPSSITGSTPSRRPPSAIQPQPQTPVAAKPAPIGPKGTQKLEE
jgi:hypothetical protein